MATLKDNVYKFIDENPLAERLYSDYRFRTVSIAAGSLLINLFLAFLKGVVGLFTGSWWLITLAAYYILLALIRYSLIKAERRIRRTKGKRKRLEMEWRMYGQTGAMLMGMTIVLQGIVVLILQDHNSFHYAGFLIYGVAAYDFFCLVNALIFMLKNRKKHTPLTVTLKTVSLSSSLVSMLSLQTAMISAFGEDGDFRYIMCLVFGSAVCVIIFALGLNMVIRYFRHKRARSANKTAAVIR